MAYCWKCGGQLVQGSQYCHTCGASVKKTRQEEFSVSSDELISKVKELIREGNVRNIVVKDETGKVLFEIPVTIGVIGAVLAPWLAAIGVIAAMVTRCTLVVERQE